MRSRIQLKVVTEQMKYLEEQMQFMEPVIGVMKNALEKSKRWVADTNDNPSITYTELCQELASATTALLDVASNILSENEELVDVDGRTPSLAQATLEPTKTEKPDQSESTIQHSLMYKLLQQRLMPIDKLIQIFNQNLETREKRITKLENIEDTISKLSKDLNLTESRVCNRYVCYVRLADPTPVSIESIISTFDEVLEYNGQHFNQTTGTFVSPHDGLYLVCVTLHEWEGQLIGVSVMAGDMCCKSIEVKCAYTSAAGSVVVDMKKGQELYLRVYHAEQGANLSYYSSFTIVSL
ncbi:uncharacterized protein LOC131947438 [Physella acuta]|uniref:uncharacterized protein LOC131947438 n=1 Tax=Physella acuta TaxID=109671 RepID=UPI0027DDB5E3|nr:uncharacterized protein LOC131947438 [Physella acuta]